MLVALQLVGVAAVPLNVTVLVPCVVPKLVPVMVIDVPTVPELGLKLAILGEPPLGVPFPPPQPAVVRKSAKIRIDSAACHTVPYGWSIFIADILISVLCSHIWGHKYA
jgi:hypothetical protein